MEVAEYHVFARVPLSTVVNFQVPLPVNVINRIASKETVSIDFFNKNLGSSLDLIIQLSSALEST